MFSFILSLVLASHDLAFVRSTTAWEFLASIVLKIMEEPKKPSLSIFLGIPFSKQPTAASSDEHKYEHPAHDEAVDGTALSMD